MLMWPWILYYPAKFVSTVVECFSWSGSTVLTSNFDTAMSWLSGMLIVSIISDVGQRGRGVDTSASAEGSEHKGVLAFIWDSCAASLQWEYQQKPAIAITQPIVSRNVKMLFSPAQEFVEGQHSMATDASRSDQ
jgi:hypothetical protein